MTEIQFGRVDITKEKIPHGKITYVKSFFKEQESIKKIYSIPSKVHDRQSLLSAIMEAISLIDKDKLTHEVVITISDGKNKDFKIDTINKEYSCR